MIKAKTEQEFLARYNIHDFDVPLISVDMSIFTIKDGQLKILLVKRAKYPAKGLWALPGGFINLTKDQQLEDTVARKLIEKTGIATPYLEQVVTIGNSKRDPRGWSVTIVYMALIASEDIKLTKDTSSEEVSWIAVEKAAASYNLAFDHQSILAHCYKRLRSKVQYTSLPVNLLPSTFTLTELQKTFEIILNKAVEKKSFRRRILNADILEETGEMKSGGSRPARLYHAKTTGRDHFFPRNIEGPR